MRRTVLALNAMAAAFFACFLAYTFAARQHLDGLARRFVTEKTVQYSAPIVELADVSLATPAVRRALTAEQLAAIRQEIAEYRQNPSHYVAELTRPAGLAMQPAQPIPPLAKVAAIKERIRAFYDNTLKALVDDLRIFATSNLLAATIALSLAWRSRERTPRSVVWFSFLMFASVLYGSCLYLDDLTFFRILFRSHMGWWYAVFLCAIIVALYLEYGRLANPTPPSPVSSDGASAAKR